MTHSKQGKRHARMGSLISVSRQSSDGQRGARKTAAFSGGGIVGVPLAVRGSGAGHPSSCRHGRTRGRPVLLQALDQHGPYHLLCWIF